MPEISRLGGYSLPEIRYAPPRTPSFEAAQIVPDLRGASALQGSAVSMGLVADTLSKLPQLISAATAAGRKESQQKAVHEVKMGALAGGKSPADIRALQGLSFGEDDSLSYKPVDPYLAELERRSKESDITYKGALAKKALRGNVTLADKLDGADPSLPLPEPDEDFSDDGMLPALPNVPASSPAGRAALAVIPDEPPLMGEPALGADVPVAIPIAKPVGALSGAGAATGPIVDTAPATPATTGAPATLRGFVKRKNPQDSHRLYDDDGNLIKIVPPGGNSWITVKDEDKGMRFATKEAAETAGWDTSGAKVNEDSTITVKKIPIAKDQPVPAALAQEARNLGLNPYGKTPSAVNDEIVRHRQAQNLLTPEQVKNANALQTRLSSDVAYKDIQNVKQAYTAMQGVEKINNAASDVALINSFQRIIDPGVSVREGDVTLLQNSQGLYNKIKAIPGVLTGEQRVSPEMKAQMIELGRAVYKSKVQNFYDSKGKSIVEQAKAYNVPTELLGLDFGIPIEGVLVPGVKPATTTAPAANVAVATGAPNGKPAEGGLIVGKRYLGDDGALHIYLGGPIDDEASFK